MPARLPRASMGHAVLLPPSISFRLPLLWRDRRFRSGRNYPPKSFPVISFADPHPLTPLESYRFKNQGGEGCPSPSPLTTRRSSLRSSPFLSYFCRQSCTTEASQLLFNQPVTHSFPRNGGCTPGSAIFASRLSGTAATRLSSLPRYHLISLLLYVPTSRFLYNRCASIRGSHEFPPASRGDQNRLRAAFLGCQPQRDLRAALLLRRLRVPGSLPAAQAEFLHAANRHADGHFRRHGLVPGHFRGRGGGQTWLSSRIFARLPHPRRRLLSDWLHRRLLARAHPQRRALGPLRRLHPDPPRAGHLARQTLRRRHYRSHFQGKRALHRLFHLLHHGEHRRGFRPLRRLLGASSSRRRKRLPRRGPQCLPDVFRG